MVELIVAGRQGDNIGETIVTVANVPTGWHERDEVSQRAPDTHQEEDYRDPESFLIDVVEGCFHFGLNAIIAVLCCSFSHVSTFLHKKD